MKLFDIEYNKNFPYIHITKESLFGILFNMLVIGVLAFIYETIVEYIFTGYLMDRGFLCGPFIPIYAVFSFIVCLINYFPKPTKKSILYIAFFMFVFSIIFEETIGLFSEHVFHAILWQYKFPLTSPSGYTNLFVSIGWMIFGTLYIVFFIPFVYKLSKKINDRIKWTLVIEIVILILIDLIYTLYRNNVNGEYVMLYKIKGEVALTLFVVGIFAYLIVVSLLLFFVSKEIRKLSNKLDPILLVVSSIILLVPFFAAYEYLERTGIKTITNLAAFGFIDAAFLIYFALSLIVTSLILFIYVRIIKAVNDKKELNTKFYFYKHKFFKAFFFLGNMGLSILVIIIGIISLKNPTTTTLDIGSGDKTLKIVAVSDIHYLTIGDFNKLSDLVSDLNKQDADVIFFLGDTVDNYMQEYSLGAKRKNYADSSLFAEYMNQIKSTYGIYDINGNHEFETNDAFDIRNFFNDVEEKCSNFHYLDDEAVTIANAINVVGRRDYKIGGKNEKRKTIKSILSSSHINNDLDLIVLDHQPQDYKDSRDANAILQLSGHTHNGQIFPGDIIVSLFHQIKYGCISNGLYEEDAFKLYISRGYGAWGFPLRTTGTSEIVVIYYHYS